MPLFIPETINVKLDSPASVRFECKMVYFVRDDDYSLGINEMSEDMKQSNIKLLITILKL